MAIEDQFVYDRNGDKVRVGDRVTRDDYWAYEVFGFTPERKLLLVTGTPVHPSSFTYVAPERVRNGRVI